MLLGLCDLAEMQHDLDTLLGGAALIACSRADGGGVMSTSTDRQTFRETVALVAEKAKAMLPRAVNGRIESAVKLVLVHDVMPQADGTILVGSSRDPLQSYRLVGTACECQDFTHGQAPDGWCQHRIAAGIAKRVQELLPREPARAGRDRLVGLTDDSGAEAPVQPEPSRPCPRHPAPVNVRVLIAGREVQWTLTRP